MPVESEDDSDLTDIEFHFVCTFKLSPVENSLYRLSYSAYWTVLGLLACGVYLSTISALLGIISWMLIKKWRTFQNYLLLSGIVLIAALSASMYFSENINCLNHFAFFKNDKRFFIIVMARVWLQISTSHWLLVAAVTFCTDFVKTFKNPSRYLVTNLFVWIAPVLETAITFSVIYSYKLKIRHVDYIAIGVTSLYLLASEILYGTVILKLICRAIRECGAKRHCIKITLCLTACIASIGASYIAMTILDVVTNSVLVKYLVYGVSVVNVISFVAFFQFLPSHRHAWSEYILRRNT